MQSAPAIEENELAEAGAAGVGSLGAQLERYQIGANMQPNGDVTRMSSMGLMWAADPAPAEPPHFSDGGETLFGESRGRRDSAVNFNFEEVEEVRS